MHTQYTPFLWQQMEQLHRQQPFSGHTPGHKNGAFLPAQLQQAWGAQFASYDYTELDGLDNLHFSGGCIAQSQQQAAAIFGAGQCFYLVNGTTAGLQAAIMAACSNQKVFVPRHVHRSVYHSLLLAHAEPVYLPLELDPATSLPTGIRPELLQQYMQQYPDCRNLILVNPTYQGITAGNVQCVQLAKQHGLTVIVDEAHGSHLHFHPEMPPSLLDAGADLVVQSWHKTLPVLTQGSALLVHEQYSGPSPEPFLSLLQTTSPSYLLMASLEAGSIYMGEQAQQQMQQSLPLIFSLHEQINSTLQTLHVLWQPQWQQDPFKLYLISDRLSGAAMDAYLRTQQTVYSEMHDNQGILFILPYRPLPNGYSVSIRHWQLWIGTAYRSRWFSKPQPVFIVGKSPGSSIRCIRLFICPKSRFAGRRLLTEQQGNLFCVIRRESRCWCRGNVSVKKLCSFGWPAAVLPMKRLPY